MKKRPIFLLLFLAGLLFPIASSLAQEPVDRFDNLKVAFWPDYDRASVLVLLTGGLPSDTALPAEVSIPIPDNAEINAVAQLVDGELFSIEYDVNDDAITFVSTSPGFHVEYYAPYELNGRSRSYDFEWQSASAVSNFAAEIQQPADATSLDSDPEAQDVFTSQVDGLVYHSFNPRALSAGTPYRLSFDYELASDSLTVDPAVSGPAAGAQAPSSTESDTNWPMIAGVLALIALAIGGTWLIATRSSSKKKSNRPRKPSPKNRQSRSGATIYCHVCGQPAEGDDRFCRNCGAELKQL